MCALNWRHHPEKDKEEEGERGGKKGKREAGREGMATAEMGEFFFFLLYPLWGDIRLLVRREKAQLE